MCGFPQSHVPSFPGSRAKIIILVVGIFAHGGVRTGDLPVPAMSYSLVHVPLPHDHVSGLFPRLSLLTITCPILPAFTTWL